MKALEAYARLRGGAALREETPAQWAGELELQARFFAGEFGLAWQGEDGESIEVVRPGVWNREAGPDFKGAVVRINGTERQGDIELDGEDADWERHHHACNPAFGEVVLHVFFRRGRRRHFTRNFRNEAIAQVCLRAQSWPLRRPVPSPWEATPVPADPCALRKLVAAAAEFRLARKRDMWLRACDLHGRDQALFQALAAGLGYKNNKMPFLLLAQRLGLRRARAEDGEALLFGVAGFLEKFDFETADDAARAYARTLWQRWWKLRSEWERLILPPEAWKFSSARPSNHPHRRLGALAVLARHFAAIRQAAENPEPSSFLDRLGSLRHPFWQQRFKLGGLALKQPCALIGTQRAADLAANVLAPMLPPEHGLQLLGRIPAGTLSGQVRRVVTWLGGPEKLPAKLLRTAIGHQGLLQIYEDFYSPSTPQSAQKREIP